MGLIFTKDDLKEVSEEVAKYKVNFFTFNQMFGSLVLFIYLRSKLIYEQALVNDIYLTIYACNIKQAEFYISMINRIDSGLLIF